MKDIEEPLIRLECQCKNKEFHQRFFKAIKLGYNTPEHEEYITPLDKKGDEACSITYGLVHGFWVEISKEEKDDILFAEMKKRAHYIDEFEVEKITGIKVSTLQQWRKTRIMFPYYKIGRKILYSFKDVLSTMGKCRIANKEECIEAAKNHKKG